VSRADDLTQAFLRPPAQDSQRTLKSLIAHATDSQGLPIPIPTGGVPAARGVGISPEAQSPGPSSGGAWPVKALEGERRPELDENNEPTGCYRVVRILWEMSNGEEVWMDYEDLLDEENWTDV
jgi:hypothetical protein